MGILAAACIIAAGFVTPQRAYSAAHLAMLDATVLTRAGVIERDKDHLVLGPGALIPTGDGTFVISGSDRCPHIESGINSERCTVIFSGVSEHVVHLIPDSEGSTTVHTDYNPNGLLILWGDPHPNDVTNRIIASFLGGLWDAKSEVIAQHGKYVNHD